MKKIKCDLFVFVGYPHSPICDKTIDVPDDFKESSKIMNEAGWRKCGSGTKDVGYGFGRFGYFCPEHAETNQFYVKKGRYAR